MREFLFDFSRTRLSLNRPLGSYSKLQWLYGLLIRNRSRQLHEFSSDYVNLGCGPEITPGFVNVDYEWRPSLDLCWDVTQGLPFPSASMAGIFTEHMLEHISLEKCHGVLQEMRRILRPGGIARIVVPDAGLYLDRYAAAKRGESVEFPYAQASDATPLMSVNRIYYSHGHRYLYDFDTLRHFLTEAGFSEVARASVGQGRDPKLLLDTPSRAVESLYVEAVV